MLVSIRVYSEYEDSYNHNYNTDDDNKQAAIRENATTRVDPSASKAGSHNRLSSKRKK